MEPINFDDIKLQLPFSKIRGICLLDPDVDSISAEAVKLIAKATEYFIEELASACYTQAVLDKRKTVNKKDIDKVIQNNPMFEFLEDTLDDWLEDVLDKIAEESAENELEQNPDVDVTENENVPEVEEIEETVPIFHENQKNSAMEELF